MSPLAITAVIFALMLVLMALRTPIAVAMFVAGSVGYVAQAGWLPFATSSTRRRSPASRATTCR
jgi:hypothetical protein